MSDAMDALIPPKPDDFVLVPLPEPEEELDGDDMVPTGYDYDTHLMVWKCLDCGSAAVDTTLHTAWHERLDSSSPNA